MNETLPCETTHTDINWIYYPVHGPGRNEGKKIWFSGRLIGSRDKYCVEGSSLIIINAVEEDGGEYVCEAADIVYTYFVNVTATSQQSKINHSDLQHFVIQ